MIQVDAATQQQVNSLLTWTSTGFLAVACYFIRQVYSAMDRRVQDLEDWRKRLYEDGTSFPHRRRGDPLTLLPEDS